MLPGVYQATKKDKTIYFRSSITYRGKHISLGSFPSEEEASRAYFTADQLLKGHSSIEESFYMTRFLAFEKIVCLCNFRDNGMYLSKPIYLRKKYFSYYLSIQKELKFDIDDLFYYADKQIMQRKGHLFVNDYGMQVTLLSRYGIRPHAVLNRDYAFANNDPTDLRYENIIVINPYHGVVRQGNAGSYTYRASIHINGNYLLGTYENMEDAAIAYNKAVDLVTDAGISKNYTKNYINEFTPAKYKERYALIRFRKQFLTYLNSLRSN